MKKRLEPPKRTALAPRGRGADQNPRNRFEHVEVEADPEALDEQLAELEDGEQPSVATEVLRDSSRTILAHNDSPDVGFDTSINPYRGCEHGCAYCLAGDTPILLADGSTRPLGELRVGDEIYGTERRGFYRRYVRTKVLNHWQVRKPAYRVVLEDGTTLVTAGDHRFLTERGWKFVASGQLGLQRPHLTLNNKLMGTGRFATGVDTRVPDYRRGYLSGLIRGDGHLAAYDYERPGRSHGRQYRFRLALTDDEALQRATRYLSEAGVPVQRFLFQPASSRRRALNAIRTSSRPLVDEVSRLVEWPAAPSVPWQRGYLAGLFDAEGSYSTGILRLSNTDETILGALHDALHAFGFASVSEQAHRPGLRPITQVRLTGGLGETLRFWHTIDNAITRKRCFEGQALKSGAKLGVAEIEPLGKELQLFDITTGTGDFVANGVVSHNCYARPTHEYLGLSAGLDFETKILVKADAPALLRRELESPKYQPRVIALSGVTDPYQPLERKLRVTRGCLEVLTAARNPVVIVTKNRLVARDADLLAELAAHDAAQVMLSITTLDDELARRMEPRASTPSNRLAAISELRAAGVPCGVIAAPIIPALNDHEIPQILEAAKEAGATDARWVLLRLPHGVKELFDDWLARHYPDRREKVLGRLREARDGELYRPEFFGRQRGSGAYAEQIRLLFELHRSRLGLRGRTEGLSIAAFRRPGGQQLSLL